jgi:YD repeat-containing protein
LASIRVNEPGKNRNATARTTYTVRWRDADGKGRGQTVGSMAKAKELKKLAEKHGKTEGHDGVVRGTHRINRRGEPTAAKYDSNGNRTDRPRERNGRTGDLSAFMISVMPGPRSSSPGSQRA